MLHKLQISISQQNMAFIYLLIVMEFSSVFLKIRIMWQTSLSLSSMKDYQFKYENNSQSFPKNRKFWKP